MVGSHLVDYILEKTDWNIYGLLRWSSKLDNIEHHLQAINKKRLFLVYGDLTDHISIRNALEKVFQIMFSILQQKLFQK